MGLFKIDGLQIIYSTKMGDLIALDKVSLDLEENEKLGLVGESGCGKTTLGKAILRILPENARIKGGHIYWKDRDIVELNEGGIRDIRWKGISMITQSAMNALNPVYRIENQIVEIYEKRNKLKKTECVEKAKELFKLVGLDPKRLRDYPHQLSGGMKQRVIIAMALALNPDLIIADEPTTALDVITQDKVLKNIYSLQKKLNKSMILITHDISLVAEGCDKIAIMYAGKIMEYGNVKDIFTFPCNPYTIGLKNAFPSIMGERKDLISIPGYPPNLIGKLMGCRFLDRCPFAVKRCSEEEPKMLQIGNDHFAACHLNDKAEKFRKEGSKKETWEKANNLLIR